MQDRSGSGRSRIFRLLKHIRFGMSLRLGVDPDVYGPAMCVPPEEHLPTYLETRGSERIVVGIPTRPAAGRHSFTSTIIRELTPPTVMHQDRSRARQHIVRVHARQASPAFSLVNEFRPVRGGAWKSPAVRGAVNRTV